MIMVFALAALVATGCNSPRSQAEMNRCAALELKQVDGALTQQWRVTYAFMKGLDARDTSRGGGFGYAAALLGTQRAWLKYRDSQCVLEGAQYAGGSASPLERLRCTTRLTAERRAVLRTLVWRH